LTNGP